MPLAKPDHIIRTRDGIQTIYCKVCGTPIRDLVPSPVPDRVFRHKDKTVVHKHMVLGVLPSYVELTLICRDDEGHQNFHVTHCCSTCAASHKDDLKTLDEMYKADLDELVIGEGVDHRIVDAWRKLHVVGVR